MISLLIVKNHFSPLGNPIDLADSITDSTSFVTSSQTDWMEIFLKDKKIGYSVNKVSPLGEDYLIQEKLMLRMSLMGHASNMETVSRSVVNADFRLKQFSFSMISGVVSFKVSGKIAGNRLLLEIGEGASQRHESIELSSTPFIGSGIGHFFKGKMINAGQSYMFSIFDPSTMAQNEMIIRVIGMENININQVNYNAFLLETEMLGQSLYFWLDENGTVLKEQGFMGLTLIRSSAARAPRDIEGSGGDDFYELTAVNVKGKLDNADKLTFIKLKVKGIDTEHFDTTILGEGRQKFASGLLEISKERMPVKSPYRLPYRDDSGRMKSFLFPELFIESDHESITEKAHEIAGDIKDPVAVTRMLMNWVYHNIKKRPVVSVPSALEVLKTKVGDCNEHAVLLTALLRSCGIPARLCVGLVYTRGQFFYHAWTQGYLGEWITMDATLNQMPVDASHIQLVQGGLDKQVEIIALIGKLTLELMEYRYD